jgi:hypothetical protein
LPWLASASARKPSSRPEMRADERCRLQGAFYSGARPPSAQQKPSEGNRPDRSGSDSEAGDNALPPKDEAVGAKSS